MKIKQSRSDKKNLLALIIDEGEVDGIDESEYTISTPEETSSDIPDSVEKIINNTRVTVNGPNFNNTIVNYQRLDLSTLSSLLEKNIDEIDLRPADMDDVERLLIEKRMVHPDYVVFDKNKESNIITMKPKDSENNLLYIGALNYKCGWVTDDLEGVETTYGDGVQYYYPEDLYNARGITVPPKEINGDLDFFHYKPSTFKGEPWVICYGPRANYGNGGVIVNDFQHGSCPFSICGRNFQVFNDPHHKSTIDFKIMEPSTKIVEMAAGLYNDGGSYQHNRIEGGFSYVGFEHHKYDEITGEMLTNWEEEPLTTEYARTKMFVPDPEYRLNKREINPQKYYIKHDNEFYFKYAEDDQGEYRVEDYQQRYDRQRTGITDDIGFELSFDDIFTVLSIPIGCRRIENFEFNRKFITVMIVPPSLESVTFNGETSHLEWLTRVYYDESDSLERVQGLFSGVNSYLGIEFISIPMIQENSDED